jgi:hypothetical protein
MGDRISSSLRTVTVSDDLSLPLPDAGQLVDVLERRIEQQGGWTGG